MKITPFGAAGTVTGSRFLVQSGRRKLLVDAGLFQGVKPLRLRNWRPFPVPPSALDAIVLTHAHLDHSGFLPVLVREGFKGDIWMSPPTRDLLPILLFDAARLQEEDARHAGRKGYSRHASPRPLFTQDDVERTLPLLRRLDFDSPREVKGVRVSLHRVGHLLGAAAVHLADDEGTVLFSGDVGRVGDLLLPAPAQRPEADRVVLEGTYGDRSHDRSQTLQTLAEVVNAGLGRGGTILIPTFAVGRAQTLALALYRLRERGGIPDVPMYLNSPMANEASGVHLEHADELRPSREELAAALEAVQPVTTTDESRALNRRNEPKIILAGAGMLTGGRILHHLEAFGQQATTTLVLAGYQAEGTRGRRLLEGDRRIRVHGQWLELRCRVELFDAFSGHGDRDELEAWLRSAPIPPLGVSLVHGEPQALERFRQRLDERLQVPIEVAEDGRPLGLDPWSAAEPLELGD
ncbi:MAG: MBL fold metallo-hydrolase [Gemmatimonadales bacterium]|nr:MAG: MBL fold metallo-hydrolase [Gemmatimonadales bacterium]